MALLSGITYKERPASPAEDLEADGCSAQRILDCAGEDRVSLARVILGYPQLTAVAGTNKRYVSRKTPWYHPDYLKLGTLTPYLYAKKVRTQPLGVPSWNSLVATYPKARLTVTFDTPPFEILFDEQMVTAGATVPFLPANVNVPDESSLKRYVSRRVVPGGEFLTVPAGTFKYVLVPPPFVAFGVGKLLVHSNVVLTWHAVPEDAVPAGFINPNVPAGTGFIENTIGRVNKGSFNRCPSGTLLLLSAEFKPIKSVVGTRTYDISYAFKLFMPRTGVNTYGHNYIFKPPIPGASGTGWTEVTTTGTTNIADQTDGVSIYDWADFAGLFRPPDS